MEYCSGILLTFSAKHSLDSISLEIVDRHALSYVLVQVTANAPLVPVKLVRVRDNPVNENQDSYSYSCLCERSLTRVDDASRVTTKLDDVTQVK